MPKCVNLTKYFREHSHFKSSFKTNSRNLIHSRNYASAAGGGGGRPDRPGRPPKHPSLLMESNLPPSIVESVMSILVSVQWDCWRFFLPAKPLVKLHVAVESHGDLDHWHSNLRRKDLVLVPWKLRIPDKYASLKNIVRVDRSIRVSKLKFTCLDLWTLKRLLQEEIKQPHAFWWLAESENAKVLFVGDVDAEDVSILRSTIHVMHQQKVALHSVLLPSYGGVTTHGARNPTEISQLIKEIAQELQGCVVLGALPHPVHAEWANFNAVRM